MLLLNKGVYTLQRTHWEQWCGKGQDSTSGFYLPIIRWVQQNKVQQQLGM